MTLRTSGVRALLMLDGPSLARALAELKHDGRQASINCFVYRSIALRHFLPPELPRPLFASPPGKQGSRFIPPDKPISALYVALEAETAHREGNPAFYQILEEPGFDLSTTAPTEAVLIGIYARLSALLDVRSSGILGRLHTTDEELASRWRMVPDAPTQRLGSAVHNHGDYEGLIYPSAQHAGGNCLVLFPDRLQSSSEVRFRSMTMGVPDARVPNHSAGPTAP